MTDQSTGQVYDDSDTVRVGDLIKICPVLGPRRNAEDYYLVLTINKDQWRALFNGKIITMSGMTSTSVPGLVVSRSESG